MRLNIISSIIDAYRDMVNNYGSSAQDPDSGYFATNIHRTEEQADASARELADDGWVHATVHKPDGSEYEI